MTRGIGVVRKPEALAIVLVACTVASALSRGTLAAGATTRSIGLSIAEATTQKFTLYSVVTKKLFINNVDDLSRGQGHNPFGNFSTVPPPTNERVFGPISGDEGVFAFDLYTKADLKSKAGSGVFICWYNFNQNAFCDASFQLSNGSLIGKGAFSFNAPKFALAIIGGSSRYRSTTGAVQVTGLGPATQAQPVHRAAPIIQKQRLVFLVQSK